MFLNKFKEKKLYLSLFVFISILGLTLVLTQEWIFNISFLKELELKLLDKRFLERGEINIKNSSDVTILEIDQESFNQLPKPYNKYPLNRLLLAKLVENLNQAGAKVIGIDILLSALDNYSSDNDKRFIEDIKKYKNVVLAGKVDESDEFNRDQNNFNVTSYKDTSLTNIKYDFGCVYSDVDSSIGIVRVAPDNDNVYRRYLPYINVSGVGKLVPSFGYAILNKYYKNPTGFVATRSGSNFIFGNRIIPQYDKNSTLINFYGSNKTFPSIKLIDVVDDKEFKTKDEIDYEEEINNWETVISNEEIVKKIRNKIILVGSTMPEDRDILAVSISKGSQKGDNNLYGVEFHANAIQNVINNDFLEIQSKLSEILFISLLCAITFWGSALLRKVKVINNYLLEILNAFIVLFLLWVVFKIGIYWFINFKVVTAIITPSAGIVLGYLGSTAFHFIKERQQNVFIKGVFSQYVNQEIVQELISNPDKLKLGGEKKKVTILFSDMAGFTTFSENKDPEMLVNFMNGLLHELTELIFKNNGTLDKYLGDAVMAFWGAPIETPDHAYLACIASLEMQKKVQEISKQWEEKGERPLRIRIGINTGDVVVGNVGGIKHKNYTVVGDNVNLASRLEGANKEYSTYIMISEATFEIVKEYVLVRELDLLRVKGKTKPTRVYELLGLADDIEAKSKLNNLKDYFAALNFYSEKNFNEARLLFEKCYSEVGDYTSMVYAERCKLFLEHSPGNDWDGVFILKTK